MGYNTKYAISVRCNNSASVIANVRMGSVQAACAIDSQGNPSEGVTWYDHERELRTASLWCKDVLFTLTGYGEESGDAWRKYFMNGKMQMAKAVIAFQDFDVSQLV